METLAVVLREPKQIALEYLPLKPLGDNEVEVAIEHSAISTGTERLLWSGTMPTFPGMGYPLVPGYEAVGRIVDAGKSDLSVGQQVFVPGAQCFQGARGLFGAAAARLIVPASRVLPLANLSGDKAVLLALAATALHVFADHNSATPDLIVGHGTLGRLLARAVIATGAPAPVVWETDARRAEGAAGYTVCHPSDDARRDYRTIVDVSGDATVLDKLVQVMAPKGEIVLAGFYSAPINFAFAPAFMRETRLRIAAQWQPADLERALALAASGALDLDGIVTHRADALDAKQAYRTAFEDATCLKMVLDWRACA